MRGNTFHTCMIVYCLAKCLFVSSSTNLKYNPAEIGICEDVQTKKTRCAMESSDCKPQQIDNGVIVLAGEKWYSAYEQKQRGQEVCSCQDTPIGSCNSRCSPQELGYCDHSSEIFQDALTNNLNFNNQECKCNKATYGACQDLSSSMNHFCALSPSDCEEHHHHFWVKPSMTKSITGLDCSCKQVRVGGCVGNIMGFTCALSKDDCPFDEYYPPYSLKMLHGYTCNLCVLDGDTSGPDPDELDSPALKNDDDVKALENELSSTAKFFISVAVIAGIGGFAYGVFVFKKRRSGGDDVEVKSSNPPPSTIVRVEIT